MKFGKEFKKQMVPEWTEAYMNYNGLKRNLREILQHKIKKQNSTTPLKALHNRIAQKQNFSGLEMQPTDVTITKGDVEDRVMDDNTSHQEDICKKFCKSQFFRKDEDGGDVKAVFFKKLDEELNKVNAFYKDKVEEMIREASLLNKQIDALIALRIKVGKPNVDGGCSVNVVTANPLKGIDRDEGVGNMETTIEVDSSSGDDSELCTNPLEIKGVRRDMENNDYEVDPLKILDRVRINNTLESPVSTIKGLFMDSKEEELSFNNEELKKVEERLRVAFIEFYQKLLLLKHYSYTNLAAFSKIMKKYDKITSRRASRSYMKIVDDSYLGSSDEVGRLLEMVEYTFVKHFSNSDRRKGMKALRPKEKREKHSVTFFSGFLSGCSIALLVVLVLRMKAQKLMEKKEGISYAVNIIPLYSLFVYIILHMLTYAANVYFWRCYKVNYPFIFGFKRGTELGYREVFLLSNGLAVLALASFLANLHLESNSNASKYKSVTQLLPLGLVAVVLAILFCPFDIVYRSSRFFFIRCLFRCVCAPLYKVRLPDFFLADHLTSQVQAIRSLELYICYYGLGEYSRRQSKCHNHGVRNALYFVVSVIPFWIRFLQCFRRICEDKNARHAYNGLKYMSTIVAMVMRTICELRQGKRTWMVWALISSGIATMANTYWDIVVDWGLLRRKSKNPFLRDKLVVSHRSVYFGAMALNVLLRADWMQLALEFNLPNHHKMAASTLIACLEIIRRGIWSFFRLENEHLNNIGKYRAFKSVPLPFNYYDSDDSDEKNG